MKEFNEKEMCAITEYIWATAEGLPNTPKYNIALFFHNADSDTPDKELYTPEFEAFWKKLSGP